MDYENIIAGLTPGGANKVYEARILICYLLKLLDKPLSRMDINNILQYQGLVNYFTFAQALSVLIEDGQVIGETEGEDQSESKYVLTDKGKETYRVFKDTIALTVREKLAVSAEEYFKNMKKLQDNEVNIKKAEDGYIVSCRVKDIGSDLITIDVFSPDMETAKLMKKNFMEKSFELYQYVFDFLTFRGK